MQSMLLIDTWGSPGDANNEEALFTISSTETKYPIVITVTTISSTSSQAGTAMISPFVALSICIKGDSSCSLLT